MNDPLFHGAHCPECRAGWTLFPPVKIIGEDKYRCVECKGVFDHAAIEKATKG